MKIMIFDSICPLCSANASFVLKHDKTKLIHITSTQSELGEILCKKNNIDPKNPTTFVFIDEDNTFTKGDAALRICRYLTPPFNTLQIFAVIPKKIRNKIYDVVAKNRYKIFGRKKKCFIPDKNLRNRFLEKKSDLQNNQIKNQTIFEEILQSDYEKLPDLLKKLHDGKHTKTWSGIITVKRSSGALGYIVGMLIGLPPNMQSRPFSMTFHKEENGKSVWTRTFDQKTMSSSTKAITDRNERLMLDTIGPVSIGMSVKISGRKIEYTGKKAFIFGLKTPSLLNPKITSTEECHEDHATFDVSINIPIVGPVARYHGVLFPPAPS